MIWDDPVFRKLMHFKGLTFYIFHMFECLLSFRWTHLRTSSHSLTANGFFPNVSLFSTIKCCNRSSVILRCWYENSLISMLTMHRTHGNVRQMHKFPLDCHGFSLAHFPNRFDDLYIEQPTALARSIADLHLNSIPPSLYLSLFIYFSISLVC